MPLVEPDVVLKGAHSLEVAVEVNARVHASLFKAMAGTCDASVVLLPPFTPELNLSLLSRHVSSTVA